MIFAISVCIFCIFCIFWVHFFCIFYVLNIEDVLCTFCFDILCFIFIYLRTFFAFFASADRRSSYITYRDHIGDNQYGESYNFGNKQYSSKNLSYCPIHRFLESVPLLNMETSQGQLPASLPLTGTRLPPSPHSSGRPEILPGSLPRDTDSDDEQCPQCLPKTSGMG